ncbi:MAG: glycoside hydrolase family 3 N-terminal domain-containing protein, partial [Elusimicrobiota bacterium]
ITGRQAGALGINWIFAPVVDLAVRPDNPIVNIRSFGKDPSLVTRLGRAFIRGAKAGGAAACLKHFPGHGDTWADSHLDLARIERALERSIKEDLAPYRALAGECPAVMSAHLVLNEMDPRPASLSKKWLSGVLRRRIGFDGVIITDALMMGAIVKNFDEEEALRLALDAGNDLLLYPPDPWRALKILDKLQKKGQINAQSTAASVERIRRLGESARPLGATSMRASDFLKMEKAHLAQSLKIARDGLAWLRPPRLRRSLVPEALRRGPPRSNFHFPRRKKILYAELDNKKSKRDKTHQEGFLRMLTRDGFEPIPFANPEPGNPNPASAQTRPLLIAIFHKPRAFSGRIGLSEEEQRLLCRFAARGSLHRAQGRWKPQRGATSQLETILIISFGDPYVIRDIPQGIPVIGAFCDCLASRLAILEFLKGNLKIKRRWKC